MRAMLHWRRVLTRRYLIDRRSMLRRTNMLLRRYIIGRRQMSWRVLSRSLLTGRVLRCRLLSCVHIDCTVDHWRGRSHQGNLRSRYDGWRCLRWRELWHLSNLRRRRSPGRVETWRGNVGRHWRRSCHCPSRDIGECACYCLQVL